MFSNVGKKLKELAVVFFVLEVIGALVAGIILIVKSKGELGTAVLYGLLCVVGGGFMAWVTSLALYGIGEAADKSAPGDYIKYKYGIKDLPQNNASQLPPHTCPSCGETNDVARVFCKKCGARLS